MLNRNDILRENRFALSYKMKFLNSNIKGYVIYGLYYSIYNEIYNPIQSVYNTVAVSGYYCDYELFMGEWKGQVNFLAITHIQIIHVSFQLRDYIHSSNIYRYIYEYIILDTYTFYLYTGRRRFCTNQYRKILAISSRI